MKKLLRISIPAIFVLLAIVSGCKKEEKPPGIVELVPPSPTSPKSVYICGYEMNANGKNVAKYWKDEVEVVLSDGVKDAVARAIWVEGNDIYLAGSRKVSTAGSLSVPVYWKNGVLSDLSSDPAVLSEANDIFVQGQNVYIVGNERNEDGVSVAKLWVNAAVTNLSDGIVDAGATGVFVQNGTIHVVGWQSTSSVNSASKAIHWTDGVPQELPSYDSQSSAFDVEVYNGDIYIGGVLQFDNGYYKNMLWKNNQPQYSTLALTSVQANGMFLNKGDIYMAGSLEDSQCTACYWKNENLEVLCPVFPSEDILESAMGICVENEDVYVVGVGSNSTDSGLIGMFWKNGVPRRLGNSIYNSGAYDITIK
jgi:hypothetical protein